jgi:hypothetical protein
MCEMSTTLFLDLSKRFQSLLNCLQHSWEICGYIYSRCVVSRRSQEEYVSLAVQFGVPILLPVSSETWFRTRLIHLLYAVKECCVLAYYHFIFRLLPPVTTVVDAAYEILVRRIPPPGTVNDVALRRNKNSKVRFIFEFLCSLRRSQSRAPRTTETTVLFQLSQLVYNTYRW